MLPFAMPEGSFSFASSGLTVYPRSDVSGCGNISFLSDALSNVQLSEVLSSQSCLFKHFISIAAF
jgi:hypothetical protein